MSKTMLALVASLATLVATSSRSQAAFTVSVTFPGFSGTAPNANAQSVLAPTSTVVANGFPGPANLDTTTSSTLTATGGPPFNRSVVSLENGNGTTERFLSVAATQSAISTLLSNFTLTNDLLNGTGVVVPQVVITITQDAYTFSPAQNAFTTSFTVLNTTTPFSGTTVSYNARAVLNAGNVTLASITVPTFTLSPTGLATNVSAGGSLGAAVGTGSLIQTFTINNLQVGQHISFQDVRTTAATPLPATGLMAALGLPMLGLAGAFRRRVLG